MSRVKNIVWLWLLLFVSGSQAGHAQLKAYFEQTRVSDVCADVDNREFIITLNLGRISRSDSLFGFNYKIWFNPEKIRFIRALYTGTLGEFFEQRDISFYYEEKYITGYATTFNFSNPPVQGDKPLVAIAGEFLSECPDTSWIELAYIEFTEEFTNEVTEMDGFSIKSEEAQIASRRLTAITSTDSLEFNEDTLRSALIGFEYEKETARLDTISLELKMESDVFKAFNVSPVNQNVEILNAEDTDNGIKLDLGINGNINNKDILKVDILKQKNEDKNDTLFVNILRLNDCSCVIDTDDSRINLRSFYVDTTDTTDVVFRRYEENDCKAFFNRENDEFIIDCGDSRAEGIRIFDIRGVLVENIKPGNFEGKARIDAEKFDNGIYFALIMNKSKINKVVLIKN